MDQRSQIVGASRFMAVRVLLLLGWALSAAGTYGPWIAHETAALTVSGADMGEFAKFLPGAVEGALPVVRQPGAVEGALPVVRQWFYLPVLAVVVGVALLAGSRHLRYPWPVKAILFVLAIPVSLQLLPPVWSPGSLLTAEFRLQAAALGICWLLLAGACFSDRIPLWPRGAVAALLALSAAVLSTWQLAVCKPSIDAVYGTGPALGWGYLLCMGGLAITALGSALLLRRTRLSDRQR